MLWMILLLPPFPSRARLIFPLSNGTKFGMLTPLPVQEHSTVDERLCPLRSLFLPFANSNGNWSVRRETLEYI